MDKQNVVHTDEIVQSHKQDLLQHECTLKTRQVKEIRHSRPHSLYEMSTRGMWGEEIARGDGSDGRGLELDSGDGAQHCE